MFGLLALVSSVSAFVAIGYTGAGCTGQAAALTPTSATHISISDGSSAFCYAASSSYKSVAIAGQTDLQVYRFGDSNCATYMPIPAEGDFCRGAGRAKCTCYTSNPGFQMQGLGVRYTDSTAQPPFESFGSQQTTSSTYATATWTTQTTVAAGKTVVEVAPATSTRVPVPLVDSSPASHLQAPLVLVLVAVLAAL